MEALRASFAHSWWVCIGVSVLLTCAFPLVYVPLAAAIRKRKRSLNKASATRAANLPRDYWLVVLRAHLMIAASMALILRYMATRPHLRWELAEASVSNCALSFCGCVLWRESVNYVVHRAMHSKLLYKRFHEPHHKIPHCHGLCDGLYSGLIDTTIAVSGVMSAITVIPSMHVLAALIYIMTIAFLGFVLNHCGRELILAFRLPIVGRVVLYENQTHDDHHVYRRGNYADVLPFIDFLFGTQIKVTVRPRLPAQDRWRRAATLLCWTMAMTSVVPRPPRSPALLRRTWASMASLLEVHPDSVGEDELENRRQHGPSGGRTDEQVECDSKSSYASTSTDPTVDVRLHRGEKSDTTEAHTAHQASAAQRLCTRPAATCSVTYSRRKRIGGDDRRDATRYAGGLGEQEPAPAARAHETPTCDTASRDTSSCAANRATQLGSKTSLREVFDMSWLRHSRGRFIGVVRSRWLRHLVLRRRLTIVARVVQFAVRLFPSADGQGQLQPTRDQEVSVLSAQEISWIVAIRDGLAAAADGMPRPSNVLLVQLAIVTKGNVGEALSRLRKLEHWKATYHLDEISFTEAYRQFASCTTASADPSAEDTSLVPLRRTHDGRLGFAADYSKFLPAKLSLQMAFKAIICAFEACNSSLADVRGGVCIIANTRGVGPCNVSLQNELKFASMYVGGYPTRIARIVLVDTNPVVRVVLRGLLRAIPLKMRSKFQLTSRAAVLADQAPASALPAFLGGVCAPDHGLSHDFNEAWWARLRIQRCEWEAELISQYGEGFARL